MKTVIFFSEEAFYVSIWMTMLHFVTLPLNILSVLLHCDALCVLCKSR